MSTFAIIGAGSMLGKELVRQLLAKGQSVVKIGRNIDNDIIFDLVTKFKPDSCKALKADVVFHCASAFEGDDADGAEINFQTNALGCLNVLLLMKALDCQHCCYAGTVTSYDDFDPKKMNSYGLSKAQGERILDWGMSNVNGIFCSLRLTCLYDTEALCCNHQPWFGRIIAYASKGKNLKLPASLGGRNYMNVADAASLMISSVEKELVGYWPVCHTEIYSHTEIALMAYKEFNFGGEIIIDKSKAPFRHVNYPDGQLLFKQILNEPSISMEKGLNTISKSIFVNSFGPMDVQ